MENTHEKQTTERNAVPVSYHDECRFLRSYLIRELGRPAFGRRSWMDTLAIGRALVEIDRQAESLDAEARGAMGDDDDSPESAWRRVLQRSSEHPRGTGSQNLGMPGDGAPDAQSIGPGTRPVAGIRGATASDLWRSHMSREG